MNKSSRLSPTLSLAVAALLGGSWLAACGGDDGGSSNPDGGGAACPATGTGTLTLTVTAPVALTAQITAVGAGAPVTLAVGQTVTLPAGPYAIKAPRVKVDPVAPALIGKAFYASAVVFNGCLANGQAGTVTVTYTQEPGSFKVWVNPANGTGAVAAYDEAQLHATTDQVAGVTRKMGITQAADLAFDRSGNLWVSDTGVGGGLLGYRMETLGMPDRLPDVKITGWANARAIAFDVAGNLWGAERIPGGTDRVAMLAAAALDLGTTSTGSTVARTATVAVSLTGGELVDPADLAFDAAGNLWVAITSKDQIVKIAAAQLGASGAVTPTVVLKGEIATGPIQGSLNGPTSLTFDTTGNLWTAWNAGGEIFRFTPVQLAASTTVKDPMGLKPAPAGGAGVGAEGGAFDGSGGLWLGRASVGMPAALVRVPAAGVTAGGDQATDPNMSSTGLGNGAGVIVLNPTPPGLPIHD